MEFVSNINSIASYLPELIIVLSILCVFIMESIPKYRSLTFLSSCIGLVFSGILLLFSTPSTSLLFEGMLINDSLSIYFKWLILLTTLSIILVSKDDDSVINEVKGEYYGMLLIITLGMFSMVSAKNLLMIYLSIEMVSIPSYIIAGISKNDKESNEASLKYVIYGSFASGIMLFGLSLLYGITGSLDIDLVASKLMNFDSSLTIYVSILFILVGFGYKISMVPFHYWTPDVYQGAPITVAAFLSVAPKAAGFAILIRFFYTLFIDNVEILQWPQLIAVLSALTMTVGNILALNQSNVKRLLAYSSISHVGYMLVAFSVVSADSLVSIMFYIFFYLFMNLSAFYMAIYMSNKYKAETIEQWNGIGIKVPILSFFMVLSLASLAGLPPTSGFVAKVYILRNLFADNGFIWLGIVAIINTVISLYYYFKIVKAMYFMENDKLEFKECHPLLFWSIIIFSLQNIIFYIYWPKLIEVLNFIIVNTGII
jgi:NADH-quinone oxidoreductase subunit N